MGAELLRACVGAALHGCGLVRSNRLQLKRAGLGYFVMQKSAVRRAAPPMLLAISARVPSVLIVEVCTKSVRIKEPFAGWVVLEKASGPVLGQDTWQRGDRGEPTATELVTNRVLGRLQASAFGSSHESHPHRCHLEGREMFDTGDKLPKRPFIISEGRERPDGLEDQADVGMQTETASPELREDLGAVAANLIDMTEGLLPHYVPLRLPEDHAHGSLQTETAPPELHENLGTVAANLFDMTEGLLPHYVPLPLLEDYGHDSVQTETASPEPREDLGTDITNVVDVMEGALPGVPLFLPEDHAHDSTQTDTASLEMRAELGADRMEGPISETNMLQREDMQEASGSETFDAALGA